MKAKYSATLLVIGCLTVAVGCNSSPETTEVQGTAAHVNGDQFKLGEEPEGALGVISAREAAEDGEPLVLVGRVGGSENPWIDGRAAFTLLDASISVVAEGEDSEEGELCTGDCCAKELAGCTTLVKVVDEKGQLVAVDSRKLLGLKESDMVVVQGTAKKDDSGNFVMLARGVFVRN